MNIAYTNYLYYFFWEFDDLNKGKKKRMSKEEGGWLMQKGKIPLVIIAVMLLLCSCSSVSVDPVQGDGTVDLGGTGANTVTVIVHNEQEDPLRVEIELQDFVSSDIGLGESLTMINVLPGGMIKVYFKNSANWVLFWQDLIFGDMEITIS